MILTHNPCPLSSVFSVASVVVDYSLGVLPDRGAHFLISTSVVLNSDAASGIDNRYPELKVPAMNNSLPPEPESAIGSKLASGL